MNYQEPVPDKRAEPFARVLRYVLSKGLLLFLTVVAGLYLTILIANVGGYMDEMVRGQILNTVTGMLRGGWLADEVPEVRNQIVNETIAQMEVARGLDRPFLIRTFYTLINALRLDFGGGGTIRQMILQALPFTLVLVGLTNLIVFIISILLALMVSRRRGGVGDWLVAVLTPLTAMPAWIHGILLVSIFAGILRILPWPVSTNFLGLSGPISGGTRPFQWADIRSMLFPTLAIVIGALFQGIYTWRSFFVTFRDEDFVELARAKGLVNALIERRYVLRPVLPFVITNFVTLAVSLWQEAIPLEIFFNWPGVGSLFAASIQSLNVTMMVGIVVVFAYLLAITTFLLDFVYAAIDPRVKMEINLPRRVSRWRRFRQNKGSDKQPAFCVDRSSFEKPAASPSKAKPKRLPLKERLAGFWGPAGDFLGKLRRSPSGVIGLVMILIMVGVSIYTIISVPMDDAIRFWRGQNDEGHNTGWYHNPIAVPPAWFNLFQKEKLPPTLIFTNQDAALQKDVEQLSEEATRTVVHFSFSYPYDALPSEITFYFKSEYQEKIPMVQMAWHTPDGRVIELGNVLVPGREDFYLSVDTNLKRKLGGNDPTETLFYAPEVEPATIVKGEYELEMTVYTFEPESAVDIEAILYGQVHGLLGTDGRRRDPMVALLWGTVMALALGLAGAVVTNILSVLLAAASAWFGGWLDALIRWIADINLIIPKLLVAILVSLLYSRSIWVVLGVLVVSNIFGSALKSYRAVFMQVKESGYIEAAVTYGAPGRRIVWHYLLPKVLPVAVPQMMIMIPGYIFMEATLAFLGVVDPKLPTWGKVIYESLRGNGLLSGQWYLVILPILLLALTGMAFTIFGHALEKILKPE